MKLYFREFGLGRPVIILHGLFGLSDNWVTMARSLENDFRVIVPDLRNHGQSPHSNIFDFQALVADVYELAEDLGILTFDLIGHSLGGKTAMYFTLQHPGMVRKLVIVDISLRRSPPNREHQLLLNAMLSVDFSTARSRGDVEQQLAKTVTSSRLRQFLLKNVYWRTRDILDWRLNLKAINENLLSVFEGVTEPGSFHGPVLFIRGGRSDYILDDDVTTLKMKFPGMSLHTIRDASHWVHADAPGEFLETTRRFLTSG